MKAARILVLCTAILLVAVAMSSAGDKQWFDLKTCGFCKHFDNGGDYIIDHMKTEYHDLPNGFFSMTVVEPEYQEAFDRAAAKIGEVSMKAQETGEIPEMCGHCTAYGELLHMGATYKQLESELAMVFLYTSDDPEMIKKLHAFAQRNREEMAKWKAEQSSN